MHKLVGLIGYPLGHTVSPAMHNTAFTHLGIDYEYVPFEIESRDLSDGVNGLRALHVAGFNVTVPYKEKVIPLLDEVTELARIIGAVNTVLNQDGKLIGYNTDGAGFIESLKEDAKTDPKDKNVVVLGAGGASRAICVLLAENKVKSLTIVDLEEEKSADLAAYVNSYFGTKCSAVSVTSPDLQKAIKKADVLINCTPIGMRPKMDQSPLPKNTKLSAKLLVYDLVYNPQETKLLKEAEAAGCKTCSGLGMLVRQGALAFTIWTGEEAPVDLRVSTIPTLHGEKSVIRVLRREHAHLKLAALGMEAEELDLYKKMLAKKNGIVLVTGPTGSGKTTTLYATLTTLNDKEVNIITIEDPVEYQLPGINQIQVNSKSGLTFARGLRSILRQDPDIIMIGEIRDLETAKIAVQAALTGHLVLATLHTNDAPSAVTRLVEMGIDKYLVEASVIGVIAQRLARKITPNGFKGRIGIYEVMLGTKPHREMRSLKSNGWRKIGQGVTTQEEVARVVFLDD